MSNAEEVKIVKERMKELGNQSRSLNDRLKEANMLLDLSVIDDVRNQLKEVGSKQDEAVLKLVALLRQDSDS